MNDVVTSASPAPPRSTLAQLYLGAAVPPRAALSAGSLLGIAAVPHDPEPHLGQSTIVGPHSQELEWR